MELTGTGFLLREWKLGDEVSLQKNADNKNISRFLLDIFPFPYTMADAEQYIAGQINRIPLTNFAIAIDGRVSGGIEFKQGIDVHRKKASLGYWLGESFWGDGIMTEAVKLVTNYAFENFDLIRIQSNVNDNNPASMRVLEKAGFTKEGVLKNAIFKDGVVMDEHVFGLCNSRVINQKKYFN